MFFSYDSREQYDQAEDASPVTQIQELQMALERAIENITELQGNLQFMLKHNEEIKEEKRVSERRYELIIQDLKKEIEKRNKEFIKINDDHQRYIDLFEETKAALQDKEYAFIQKCDQNEKYQRIINDQKSTIASLQSQLLRAKYMMDESLQNITNDHTALQELENQNDQLKYENKKLTSNLEKEINKSKKLQKQNQSFKSWLGSTMGMAKVIDGCEKVLMDQIAARLKNTYLQY